MNTSKTSLAVLAASVALLSACTSQSGGTASSAPASVPAQTQSQTKSQTPSTPASVPPTAPVVAAGPTTCKSADLAVALTADQGGGGMNQNRLVLAFTNRGAAQCTLQGSPGVSFVTGDSGTQVGAPATRAADGGAAVTLAPGASATSALTITNAEVFDPAECVPSDVRGLRVYPPGETAAIFVEHQQKACSAPEKSTMTVGPVLG